MSPNAQRFCQERGHHYTLSPIKTAEQHEIPSSRKKIWEDLYGEGIWFCRQGWFHKPVALLHSPFLTGIWLDLDCEVRGSLDPIFLTLRLGAEIALIREPEEKQHFLLPGEVNYNAGVIGFRKGAPILEKWHKEATLNNSHYAGDQNALCRAIYHTKPHLVELPPTFNWLRFLGPNPAATIYHHTGGTGKLHLLGEKKYREFS